MSDATDVLKAIDQLRRDLSGYHGQLKAHNDLQRHCDNQRKRIAELDGLYAGAKAEVAELKERARRIGQEQARWIVQAGTRASAAVRDLEQAKAENAKLRELLQDVAICACGRYCHGCPHQYDGCDRDERLRELGVEVDG